MCRDDKTVAEGLGRWPIRSMYVIVVCYLLETVSWSMYCQRTLLEKSRFH